MRSDLAEKIRNYNRFYNDEEIPEQVDNINEDIETKYYEKIKKKLFKKPSKLTKLLNKARGSGLKKKNSKQSVMKAAKPANSLPTTKSLKTRKLEKKD